MHSDQNALHLKANAMHFSVIAVRIRLPQSKLLSQSRFSESARENTP